MKETSKSILRRLSDTRFATKYFVGQGIDIGSGSDSISIYNELYPLMGDVLDWDIPQGDAQLLSDIQDHRFNFVHSSHCLEHMIDPFVAIKNWFRVLRPGGHLILLIPDEDLYEMGTFPSPRNPDHKFTFTIYKKSSWSNKSINVFNLIRSLGQEVQPIKIELLDSTYRYRLPAMDQTLSPIGECCLEIILRRYTSEEILQLGRYVKEGQMTGENFHKITGLTFNF